MRNHLSWTLCFLALNLSLQGCGAAGKPTASVSGTITFNGQPVKAGLVNFESVPPGHAAQGDLKDGNFTLNGSIAVGKYKVMVAPPRLAPPIPGKTVPLPDTKDIPKKYETPQSSDLTADLKAGSNTLKFELK